MLDSSCRPFILVYYHLRGKGQVVRSLLCYLEAHFTSIHLELVEDELERPHPETLERLRGRAIERKALPLLVDGETFVYGTYSICLHLCRVSHRPDLLGRDQPQAMRVWAVLKRILALQVGCHGGFLRLAENCSAASEREVKQLVHLTFESVMEGSGFIREICELLAAHPRGGFVLGSLTLLDFYFWETCVYVLGFFGQVDQQDSRSFESFYKAVVAEEGRGKGSREYLGEMRRFAGRMVALPSLRRNREFLESYSLLYRHTTEQRRLGLRRVWVGPPHYAH